MDKSAKENTLRVIDIIDGTIVDGPGLRTSVYVAGCAHACPGCHNPQSWPFDAGSDMTIDALIDHFRETDLNVTLSGGDPLYQPEAVISLCQAIHDIGKTVWIYTGYTYEEILRSERLRPVLKAADALVDGPFIEAQKDISLLFRGSSNQRIIDLHKSDGDKIALFAFDEDFV